MIARLMEELYFRDKDWTKCLNIARVWKDAGDEKLYKFWLTFFNSKGHLFDPKPAAPPPGSMEHA
jgi:hypothetical protein